MMKRVFIVIIAILAMAAVAVISKKTSGPLLKPARRALKYEYVKGEIDLQNAFVRVAEKVGPSVVTISTERTEKLRGFGGEGSSYEGFGGKNSFSGGDPVQKFFEEFFGRIPEREFKQQGLGSGFIIDERGYVLTNHHVIEGADKTTVTLTDGRVFEGDLRGSDPRSDLAVIKINADNLPAAKLGDSEMLKTGEWVIAIGNPFGNVIKSPEPTVTTGVVSALHRQIPSGGTHSVHLDMIQTDAAINVGNSGGPLCDIKGEVVGINVAIFSTSGGYQGVGFAIPVNTAKEVLNDLMEGKSVSYGWLGVQAQDITDEFADYFNLGAKEGVLVAKVIKMSPAERAGIKAGDILTDYENEKITNMNDLVRKVGKAKVGKIVNIKFIRDRVAKTCEVEIGKYPYGEGGEEERPAAPKEPESELWRGIRVTNITDEIAIQLGIKDKTGVVIIEADPSSSPFYELGMRRGDVIREINRNMIKDVPDFNRVTREAKGKALVRTDKGYFIIVEKKVS